MNDQLESLRKQIDDIDVKIITYLAKRMRIVRKIGKFKKEQRISSFDKKRWEQVLKSNINKGEELGLSKEFINNLLHLIHKYSIGIQEKS